MKRTLISVLLCCVLCWVVIAAGKQDTESDFTEAAKVNKSGFPIVDEKVTLNMLTYQLEYMADMSENKFLKWYEEKTNVHINMETVPAQGGIEKRNLILASGDLPEVFLAMDITSDVEAQYAQDYFLPLNELIDAYGQNIKKAFSEHPNYRKTVTNPDGNVYSLPGISVNLNNAQKYKCYINTRWLEKLGYDMPTTTDEMYEVLMAFKNKDPNDNGLKDEVPLSGAAEMRSESIPQVWLMMPFILNDPQTHLYVEDGAVKLSADKSAYREGLRWLNRLYRDEILDKESFTQSRKQLEQLARRDGDELLGCALIKSYNHLVGLGTERSEYWKFMPPLTGPAGERHVWFFDSPLILGRYTITAACENPAVAMRWADWQYSEEGTLLTFYGYEEGVDWEYAPPGSLSKGGVLDAKWMRPEDWPPPELYSTNLGNAGLYNLSQEFKDLWIQDPNDEVNIRLAVGNQVYNQVAVQDNQVVLPNMYIDQANAEKLAMLQTNMNNYIDESFARFVTGALSIDKDWDSYVKDLERFGASDIVAIYQKAYDRYIGGSK